MQTWLSRAGQRLVLFGFFLSLFGAEAARAQEGGVDLSFLTTRAEASGYEETTRYDEVQAFLGVAAEASERLHRTAFGYSVEGRPLPLVVFGEVENASAEAVRRAEEKLRVLVLANIHAGEVAGKEAALMLIRKLAAGRHAAWADSLVVLVAPIYNADGNERISLYHRPLQYGPVGGMGQRPNAQGLDLNRDFMKLDSPEARALVRLFDEYDPHVVLDLHTTNGTHHGYHLTYAPPLHPSTYAPIVDRLRDGLLPAVTDSVRQKHDWAMDYYGYFGDGYFGRRSDTTAARRGWYTFSPNPRFGTNYAGLRGRFGILSEAYAYATFEDRILASLYFTEETLDYARAHAAALRAVAEAADTTSVVGDTLALSSDYARSAQKREILLGEVEERQNPYTGETILLRKSVRRPEPMYTYGTFRATDSTRAPEAYYVPPTLPNVIDRIHAHGLRYDTLAEAETRRVERFRIRAVDEASEAYQGRRSRTLSGSYETAEVELPAGTLVVPVDQPLGRLAVALLEPRASDGLAYWAVFDENPEAGTIYPILRRPAPQR